MMSNKKAIYMGSIDALFGSKTRVKLLHLFMNNPDKAFYVREITRLIDEQINSVRRELANMLEVGIITSDSADNKLYYQVNDLYEFYGPFRKIFAGVIGTSVSKKDGQNYPKWKTALEKMNGLRVAIAAGALVDGSASPVDLLLVGSISAQKAKSFASTVEKELRRDLNYSVLSYDEFYYRLSVRDRFITEVLTNQHEIVCDVDNILTRQLKEV